MEIMGYLKLKERKRSPWPHISKGTSVMLLLCRKLICFSFLSQPQCSLKDNFLSSWVTCLSTSRAVYTKVMAVFLKTAKSVLHHRRQVLVLAFVCLYQGTRRGKACLRLGRWENDLTDPRRSGGSRL